MTRNRPPKDELVFILPLLLPIEEEIVPGKHNGAPPPKMGVFGRILAKYARIGGFMRENGRGGGEELERKQEKNVKDLTEKREGQRRAGIFFYRCW
jgi:hypothetical protein